MSTRVRRPAPIVLRLYVAGSAPNSLSAIENARAICDQRYAQRYELEVIDLLEQPGRAMEDGVIVTPTLVRLSPKPVIRIIGNLANAAMVILALGAT